ncbi:MAG: hypothetical protein LBU14_01440 [Candidatus Peribacteria bacterium]|jgi:hypothetical protein|nr:hypothetical protein [Candidatus Peribacteria bacterium]
MNKWYIKTINKYLVRTPIHSVDKYHLFQEANRMTDEVRQLNTWLLQISLIKTEDISKLVKDKRINKKLKEKDIQKINQLSSNIERMQKYKPKAEQRLQIDKEYKTVM